MKFPLLASLAFVIALSGCADEKAPLESKSTNTQKEIYIQTYDVRPNIGFDEETKEWFWGANFKTVSVPSGTELKCEVIALASDKKTELASYEYPHTVVNNGEIIPYGEFAILPSAKKSLVEAIKTFKITCKKW